MTKALDGRDGAGYKLSASRKRSNGSLGSKLLSRFRSNADWDHFRCMGESPLGQLFAEKALSGWRWKYVGVHMAADGTKNGNENAACNGILRRSLR